MNKSVLVIGGAGFIGSFLCNKLLNEGRFVVAYDNLLRGRINNLKPIFNNSHFTFIEEDANNIDALIGVIKKYNINYIFHDNSKIFCIRLVKLSDCFLGRNMRIILHSYNYKLY